MKKFRKSRNGTERSCSGLGFKALMATQFFGALNDNIFKLVVSLIIFRNLEGLEGDIALLCISSSLYVLPFVLFSSYAGYCSDRFSKTSVIRISKVVEVIVMSFGFFFLIQESVIALCLVLFLMGVHSAFFSPAKYGILPEILDSEHLSRGNGYVEFWTFVALIAGTALAGLISGASTSSFVLPAIVVLSVAVIGLCTSLYVTQVPAQTPDAVLETNPFTQAVRVINEIRKSRDLFLTLLAISYFWFIGAAFQLNTLLYAKHLLHFGDFQTGVMLTIFGVGLGLGSISAGTVSEGKVELGLVPIGALGMSFFAMFLGCSQNHPILTMLALFILGLSAGLYIVPLNAYFQHNSPPSSRGSFIAAINFLAFSGMLIAYVVLWFVLDVLGFSPAYMFILIGLVSLGVASYIVWLLPETLIRCLNYLFTHFVYSVNTVDVKNIPKTGGALLVCNHVSLADPSLVLAAVSRPVRFIMYRTIYDLPVIQKIARWLKAIPISPSDSPKELIRQLQEAKEAVDNGELVCVFAEGSITRVGQLLPFGRGLERIMKNSNTPIIPVYLDQMWGSIFSFRGGRFFWKLPKALPYPVTIIFGEALPSNTPAHAVRQTIQELGTTAVRYRKRKYQVLHLGFLRRAKFHPFRTAIQDSSGKALSYVKSLAAVLLLKKQLKEGLELDKMVGILLPPSVAGVLANLTVLFLGKVPVNLNYTASKSSLDSALSQCGIDHVITSQTFLKKLELEVPRTCVYVEDLFEDSTTFEQFKCFCLALFCPRKLIERFFVELPLNADLATVIFSSGSTGEPKGVMLTHTNIVSNVESISDLFQLGRKDVLIGVLPFFHSMGFTGTMWLPLLSGVKGVYHFNPVDAGRVGELVFENKATVLLSTPTFLATYLRKCEPEQFKTLKFVVVGAEKLKESLAKTFQKKFGVTPMEGYGCTELSPVSILNVPDYAAAAGGHLRQTGHKTGTVGHPIPGVAARIVNPDTFVPLAPGEDGLLLIKGPNVMAGYLNQPAKTRQVMHDGWYVTGDIARTDDDGFITITDRLSRFSKIGGEMVPHVKIEEELQKVLGEAEQVCVVTAVPDEKKGEKLVVLCTRKIETVMVIKQLSESGLPNLWIPKADNFHVIEAIPILGTGKVDLKAVKELAKKLVSG